MMIGDGLNDAGALSAADVGVALNEQQSGLSPAADVIMASSALRRLPEVMVFARRMRTVIYAGFTLSALYNIVGVTFAVRGALTPAIAAFLMPLSSITVVALAVALTYVQGKRSGVVG